MGFKGSLDSINLADIFQNLAINQQSGTLRIAEGETVRYVYFERGQVKFLSRGRGRGLELEDLLLGRGLVSKAQIAEANKQSQEGITVTEALVQAGACDIETIAGLSQTRVEEDIYDLFSWSSGQFEFLDGAPPADIFDASLVQLEVQMNTNTLIMEAARRIDEWERIRETIPSTKEIFVSVQGAGEGELTPPERRVLELLDGTRDVDDLVRTSAYSRFEVAQALTRFLGLDWVRPATLDELKGGISQARHRGELPQTVKLYERILSLGDEDLQVRAELAEACAATGDSEKAAIHFGVVADAYLADEKEDEAIEIYNQVIGLVPKHVPSRAKLAQIYATRGQKRQSLDHYRVLINAYIDTGRIQQAKISCAAALELDPQSVETRGALAKVYLGEGNREAAIAEYEAVADALSASNKSRAAADIYRRILHIDKRQLQVRDKLAQVMSRDKEYRKAKARKFLVRGVIFAIFLTVAGLAGWEGYARHQVQQALDDAAKLTAKEDYAGAVARLDKVAGIKSFLDAGKAAKIESLRIHELIQKDKDAQGIARDRVIAQINTLLEEAWALRRQQKLTDARAKLDKIPPLKPEPGQKSRWSDLIDDISGQEDYISGYKTWLVEHLRKIRAPGLSPTETLALFTEEYNRKKDLMRQYSEDPTARTVKLPVVLRSLPDGCDIFVNNQFKGPAPQIVRYAAGADMTIKAQKSGYKAESLSIRRHKGPLFEFKLKRQTAWQAELGEAIYAAPLIVNGQIVVTVRGGRIVGLVPATGRKKWEYRLSGLTQIIGSVAEHKGKLYFGDTSGFLHCLAPKMSTRSVAWSRELGDAVRATPAIVPVSLWGDRPYVFVGCDNGNVYCVDAATGNIKWTSNSRAGEPVVTTPMVTNQMVVAGSDDGNIFTLNVTSGRRKGRPRKMAGRVRSSPVAVGGGFVVGDDTGKLLCLRADTEIRGLNWSFSASGDILSPVRLHKGSAIYFGTSTGKLYALNAGNGKQLWTAYSAPAGIVGTPAVTDKHVYFGCSDSSVYALDRATGKLVWKYATGREIQAGMTYAGGMLYVASTDGFVYAFKE